VYDPYAAIVFSAASSDILLTVVAGKVLLDKVGIRTIDEAELQIAAAKFKL